MSKYSCLNLLKRKARQLSRDTSTSYSLALETVAIKAGFNDLHEMQQVAANNPMEQRLQRAALGHVDLEESIYDESVWNDLESAVEDQLSGLIATTNAEMFLIEDVEVTHQRYDPTVGKLTLDISFSYTGDQALDQVYSGHSISVEGELNLIRRNSQWTLDEMSGLIITEATMRE